MSELTPCNYCSLRSIRRRAEKNGQKVTLLKDAEGWTNVYVHPEYVGAKTLADTKDGEPSRYWKASMMAITDYCVC